MIVASRLEKAFGPRVVLAGLDLTVSPGAITLLVGANGAGKTTALRLLAGRSDPDQGEIAIAGCDLRRERPDALARLSFLPQAPRFHPRLTGRQTVVFHAQLRGHAARAAEAALDRWGLREFAAIPTGKLSGGLRQRLGLAVFSVAEAPVLLLDEPGLSLDPLWRQRLQQFLRREADRGKTVLVATHLLGEWEGHTDRCVLIEQGRSAGELPPDRIRDYFPRLERENERHPTSPFRA